MQPPRPFFAGPDRLLVQERHGWTLRSWPGADVMASGDGAAYPEPGGQRLLVRHGGEIFVRGAHGDVSRVAGDSEPGDLGEVAWAGAGACLYVSGSFALQPPFNPGPSLLPVPEEGCTAQVFGSYPAGGMSLWRRTFARDRSVCLLTSSGIETLRRPMQLADGRVAVERYRFPVYGHASTLRTLCVHPGNPGAEPEDLFPGLEGSTKSLAVSPGGRRLAVLYSAEPTPFPHWNRLIIQDGGERREPLTADLRLTSSPPVWSPDGRALAVTAFDGIRVGIVVVTLDEGGGEWRWLGHNDGCYSSVALGPGGREAAAVWEAPGLPPRLYRVADGGREPWAARQEGTQGPDSFWTGCSFDMVTWRHGDLALEGILALPPGEPPHPLLVHLHGGPVNGMRAGYVPRFKPWLERGFAVFAPDFRSSGIGGREAMLKDTDAALLASRDSSVGDVLTGVEAVTARPELAADRLFLLGESYGAMLVSRVIMWARRFKAAVSWEGMAYDTTLAYLLGFGGGGSVSTRQEQEMDGSPWEVPARYAASSPVVNPGLGERLRAIATPLLLIHGDHEIAPAVAFYTALRDNGVDAELVFYRGEGHVRMQRRANREDVITRCVHWFEEHGG